MKRKRYFVKRDGLLGFDWGLDWTKKPSVKETLTRTKDKMRKVYDSFQLFK